MTKLTNQQIEFAKSMTIKQRRVLQSLSKFPFYQSASEDADPELQELFRHRLVQANRIGIDGFDCGHPSWGATQAGKIVAAKLRSGVL
ncbi:hypothetical protein [Bradyrhizobium sp. SZCCHNS2096]|uniref:hypothetical protein n=1 Tax=Bradyrhizobium sp. SZCCHNS2096 TaxID=3057309 RepID=UPI002916B87D|nr:hypothetical protein [Bradyrhizobium sp. SZCCHNS2096]